MRCALLGAGAPQQPQLHGSDTLVASVVAVLHPQVFWATLMTLPFVAGLAESGWG
jgi:hypothetical protein